MLTIEERKQKLVIIKELLKEVGIEWIDFPDVLFFQTVLQESKRDIEKIGEKYRKIKEETDSLRKEYAHLKAFETMKEQKLLYCSSHGATGPFRPTVYVNQDTGIWACYHCLASGPFIEGFCMKQLPEKEDVLIKSVENVREEMFRLLNKQ